jgi:hypothetical protein
VTNLQEYREARAELDVLRPKMRLAWLGQPERTVNPPSYWPKADTKIAASCVRFRGVKRTSRGRTLPLWVRQDSYASEFQPTLLARADDDRMK